jgi:hypothetical protein
MRRTIHLVFAAVLVLAASTARATLITWALQNVTFEDGGTANGFFTVETSAVPQSCPAGCTWILRDFDIKTSPKAPLFRGYEYTTSDIYFPVHMYSSDGTINSSLDSGAGDALYFREMELHGSGLALWLNVKNFSSLTAGTFPLVLVGPDIGFPASAEHLWPYTFRRITGGAITAIPEPSSRALFGFAMAIVIFAKAAKHLGLLPCGLLLRLRYHCA